MNTKNITSDRISELKDNISELLKEEASKLNGIKKILFQILFDKIWSIFSEDCSEEDISSAVTALEKVGTEYIRPQDYMNYDEAMKLFQFTNNRNGFNELMKKHGIKQHMFKNMKIGFKKSELLVLKYELEESYKKQNKPMPKHRTYKKRDIKHLYLK